MSTTGITPLEDEKGRFQRLQEKIALQQIDETLNEIERLVNGLPASLSALRSQGYAFKGQLEAQVESLSARWTTQRLRAQDELQVQRSALQNASYSIRDQHQRGMLAGSTLNGLESKVDNAVRSLEATFGAIWDEARQLDRQLEDVSWTLQQASQASFSFEANELPVEATPANWKKPDDKDGVDGVLFLTDQRLVFEQKEEVATKKVLFIATAKQKLQSLQWALPLGQIERAEGSKRGFMGKDDFMTITCLAGAPFRSTDVHLKGETGEAWRLQIERVRSGAIQQEQVGLAMTPMGSEMVTSQWGLAMPAMFQLREGVAQVRAYGDYVYSGAASSDVELYLRQILQKHLIDVLGEVSGPECTLDTLRMLKDQIAEQVCQRAQNEFAAQGQALAYVQIADIQTVS